MYVFRTSALIAIALALPAKAQDCTQMLAHPTPLPKLYQQISTAAAPKGEYETTAQWQARTAKAGGIPTTIAAAVPVAEPASGKYDADAGTYTFDDGDLLLASRNEATALGTEYGLRESLTLSRKMAIGQNAFGAKAKMETVQSADYFFMYRDLYAKAAPFSLQFTRSPAEMKSLRPRLQVVLAGSLKPQAFEKSSHYFQATFDSPTEDFGPSFYIFANAVCVGLRDSKTGEILASGPLPQ